MKFLDFEIEKLESEQIEFLEKIQEIWEMYQKNPKEVSQELFLPIHQYILKSIAKEEARMLRSKNSRVDIKRKVQQDFLKNYTQFVYQFKQNQIFPKEIFTLIKMWYSKVIAENSKFSAIKKTA